MKKSFFETFMAAFTLKIFIPFAVIVFVLPLSSFAQVCPRVNGSPAWHRVDPSWSTHAEFDTKEIFDHLVARPQIILDHFRPAAWGGQISDYSVSGRGTAPRVSFRYRNTGVNAAIIGDAYSCRISYFPRGRRQRCEGQRLWLDLQRSQGDLEGIVSALVIDFCVTAADGSPVVDPTQEIAVNTVSSLLEGPQYNSMRFFTRMGPQAARMMQAQSAEIMKATRRAYQSISATAAQ